MSENQILLADRKKYFCLDIPFYRTLAKQWTATVEAVNLAAAEQKLPLISPDLKLYCAHHTFATDMLAEGTNLAEVKELTGHEDVKTARNTFTPYQWVCCCR